jgi:hypothetical protein
MTGGMLKTASVRQDFDVATGTPIVLLPFDGWEQGFPAGDETRS